MNLLPMFCFILFLTGDWNIVYGAHRPFYGFICIDESSIFLNAIRGIRTVAELWMAGLASGQMIMIQ